VGLQRVEWAFLDEVKSILDEMYLEDLYPKHVEPSTNPKALDSKGMLEEEEEEDEKEEETNPHS
jgi:hypothetical protein